MRHVTCPKCGSNDHTSGYGLAAGPMGAYTFCNGCDTLIEFTPDVDGLEDEHAKRLIELWGVKRMTRSEEPTPETDAQSAGAYHFIRNGVSFLVPADFTQLTCPVRRGRAKGAAGNEMTTALAIDIDKWPRDQLAATVMLGKFASHKEDKQLVLECMEELKRRSMLAVRFQRKRKEPK